MNDEEFENEVHAFMARRPKYREAHIRDMARECNERGIPFCRGCDDWHYANQECSA